MDWRCLPAPRPAPPSSVPCRAAPASDPALATQVVGDVSNQTSCRLAGLSPSTVCFVPSALQPLWHLRLQEGRDLGRMEPPRCCLHPSKW